MIFLIGEYMVVLRAEVDSSGQVMSHTMVQANSPMGMRTWSRTMANRKRIRGTRVLAGQGQRLDWKDFIFNFRQVARQMKWSDREKRDNLLTCMRGKAAAFLQGKPKEVQGDYHFLRDVLAIWHGGATNNSTSSVQCPETGGGGEY